MKQFIEQKNIEITIFTTEQQKIRVFYSCHLNLEKNYNLRYLEHEKMISEDIFVMYSSLMYIFPVDR